MATENGEEEVSERNEEDIPELGGTEALFIRTMEAAERWKQRGQWDRAFDSVARADAILGSVKAIVAGDTSGGWETAYRISATFWKWEEYHRRLQRFRVELVKRVELAPEPEPCVHVTMGVEGWCSKCRSRGEEQ